MKYNLSEIGNIPMSSSAIESFFPNLVGKNQKLRWLEKNAEIIRLKKGLYVVNPEVSGKALSTELMANHIYSPSYISMSSALRYYQLIPEEVFSVQSMTLKHSRVFETPLGRFEYTYISRDAFSIGLTSIIKDDYAFVMASPEKALCDLIANSPNLNLRFLKDAEAYLEDDIRLDMDRFRQMNADIFQDYIMVGKKADSIKTILKILKR